MGNYLSIPGVVDSEEIVSLQVGSDWRKLDLVLRVDEVATRLFHAASAGERFELMVLTTDSQIIALDEVYVSQASMSSEPDQYVHISLDAQAFRLT